jgi:hypothetical protein
VLLQRPCTFRADQPVMIILFRLRQSGGVYIPTCRQTGNYAVVVATSPSRYPSLASMNALRPTQRA